MGKYKFDIVDLSGNVVETSESTYGSYEDAECEAQQWLSDYSTGADVLALSGDDYEDPDAMDYDVYEI